MADPIAAKQYGVNTASLAAPRPTATSASRVPWYCQPAPTCQKVRSLPEPGPASRRHRAVPRQLGRELAGRAGSEDKVDIVRGQVLVCRLCGYAAFVTPRSRSQQWSNCRLERCAVSGRTERRGSTGEAAGVGDPCPSTFVTDTPNTAVSMSDAPQYDS